MEGAEAALAALEEELADPAAWATKYESAKSEARHTAAKRAVEAAYEALEEHTRGTPVNRAFTPCSHHLRDRGHDAAHGPPLPDLRPQGPRVLRPLRGGRDERRARRRPARPDAAQLPRAEGPGPGHPHLRAGRATGSRTTSSTGSTTRSSRRSTARTSSSLGLGARRHHRPDRGGRRLPRPLQDRGADGAGPAPGAHPAAGLPPDRRGDAAAARLQGHRPLHDRDPPPRERRRPDRPRGDRLAVRGRHRPDGRHPLEGPLRAPRGGDRRRASAWPTCSQGIVIKNA